MTPWYVRQVFVRSAGERGHPFGNLRQGRSRQVLEPDTVEGERVVSPPMRNRG